MKTVRPHDTKQSTIEIADQISFSSRVSLAKPHDVESSIQVPETLLYMLKLGYRDIEGYQHGGLNE
jgi:hypothetical protein